jgi:serine/threonine protein phosphatase PrpC
MRYSTGMATTAVVALITGNLFYGITAGDSAYKIIRGSRVLSSVPHGIGNHVMSTLGSGAQIISINKCGENLAPAEGFALMKDDSFTPLILNPEDAIVVCSDGLDDVACDHDFLHVLAVSLSESEARSGLLSLAASRTDPGKAYYSSCGCAHEGKDDDVSIIVRFIR